MVRGAGYRMLKIKYAIFLIALTSCVSVIQPQKSYEKAHMAIDVIEGPQAGWYLRNAGPGVALVERVIMCVDNKRYLLWHWKDWLNVSAQFEFYDTIVGKTYPVGDPFEPAKSDALFALFNEKDKRIQERMLDLIESNRIGWNIYYCSPAENVCEYVSYNNCVPSQTYWRDE